MDRYISISIYIVACGGNKAGDNSNRRLGLIVERREVVLIGLALPPQRELVRGDAVERINAAGSAALFAQPRSVCQAIQALSRLC